jgi:hypothetical protein
MLCIVFCRVGFHSVANFNEYIGVYGYGVDGVNSVAGAVVAVVAVVADVADVAVDDIIINDDNNTNKNLQQQQNNYDSNDSNNIILNPNNINEDILKNLKNNHMSTYSNIRNMPFLKRNVSQTLLPLYSKSLLTNKHKCIYDYKATKIPNPLKNDANKDNNKILYNDKIIFKNVMEDLLKESVNAGDYLRECRYSYEEFYNQYNDDDDNTEGGGGGGRGRGGGYAV